MKLVVSQQPAVSSQQTVRAGLAPAQILYNSTAGIRNIIKTVIAFFVFTFLIFPAIAQNNSDSTLNVPLLEKRNETLFTSMPDTTLKSSHVDMATGLRSNGKIYVVVAVLVIILLGLFFYLTRLDRKITRLEKGTWKDS